LTGLKDEYRLESVVSHLPESPAPSPLSNLKHKLAEETTRRMFDAIVAILVPVLSIVTTPLIAKAKFESEQRPWQALWVVLPIAAVLWVLLQTLGRNWVRPRGWILGVFVILGALSAGATFLRVFDWQRYDVEYRKDPVLLFRRPQFGGWHYVWALPVQRDPRLTIVTVPYEEDVTQRRKDVRGVVRFATMNGAAGIALDLRFQGADTTGRDTLLADDLVRARQNGFVIAGLPLEIGPEYDRLVRLPVAPNLAGVLPDSTLGHVIALVGSDDRVRALPLFAEDHPAQPAFSLRVASQIQGIHIAAMKLPSEGSIEFVRPAKPIPLFPLDSLQVGVHDELMMGRLRGQFVIVGEVSKRESVSTPWGRVLGVEVQAWAVNSLLKGRWIDRNTWWVSIIITWALLYLLASLAQSGTSSRMVGLWAGGAAAACLIFAGVAMRVSLFWIDLTYLFSTVLIFWILLIVVRRFDRRRGRLSEIEPM